MNSIRGTDVPQKAVPNPNLKDSDLPMKMNVKT